MPSRNIIRHDLSDSYYHVYGRGNSKSDIFITDDDKGYFLYLISRHLSKKPVTSKAGYLYPKYRGKIELLCFCLMDNHFHLMFYQIEKGSMADLMQSILTAYTAYFNKKYDRRGPLLESRYKSSHINDNSYLLHISRYIHLNPRSWKNYKHSSLIFIKKDTQPEWLQTDRIIDQHNSKKAYLEFVNDHAGNKKVIDEIKYMLADL